jgi:curved DNA-binding protein CbpA
MPDFCYYEALEASKTATQPEIVSSYRKLALQHHPDRNRENPNATANFQRVRLLLPSLLTLSPAPLFPNNGTDFSYLTKIQAAYETLSDPAKRARYDSLTSGASRTNTQTSSAFHRTSSTDSNNEWYFDDDDNSNSGFGPGFFDFPFEAFFRRSRFSDRSRPRSPPSYEEMKSFFAEQEAEERTYRDELLADYRAKREEMEIQRLTKVEAKRAKEDAKREAFDKREKNERAAQEKLWEELHPANETERQETCLHSEFWSKIQQKKKFKCGTCGQKRGMVSYKCPHCALLACQVCVNKFSERRRGPKSG